MRGILGGFWGLCVRSRAERVGVPWFRLFDGCVSALHLFLRHAEAAHELGYQAVEEYHAGVLE